MPLTDLNAGLQANPAPQGWSPSKHFIEYRFAPTLIPPRQDQAPAPTLEHISRAVAEVVIIDAYRRHALSADQVRRLLNLATRIQVDELLKRHGVYDYTFEDFEQDRETLRSLIRRD